MITIDELREIYLKSRRFDLTALAHLFEASPGSIEVSGKRTADERVKESADCHLCPGDRL